MAAASQTHGCDDRTRSSRGRWHITIYVGVLVTSMARMIGRDSRCLGPIGLSVERALAATTASGINSQKVTRGSPVRTGLRGQLASRRPQEPDPGHAGEGSVPLTGTIDELSVFEGARPRRTGDLALEGQGIAPIPEDSRYGGVYRMFTVWFTPNMELSGVFTGTLAVVFGLGFPLGVVALVVGTIIGSVPVAILCTWGPRTGTGQVPLARMPFGKSIVLPGTVQWLSSIDWDALVGLFGGEAAQILFGIPFWAGAALVLSIEGLVSVFGYEFVHGLQAWGSAILIVLFAILTLRIFQHHVTLPHNTAHGGALLGAFVLMVT